MLECFLGEQKIEQPGWCFLGEQKTEQPWWCFSGEQKTEAGWCYFSRSRKSAAAIFVAGEQPDLYADWVRSSSICFLI